MIFMLLNNILGKTKGIMEEGGGGSKAPPFKHSCPLHDICGIVKCNIEDVHSTNCTRYPSLEKEMRETGKNQAQK